MPQNIKTQLSFSEKVGNVSHPKKITPYNDTSQLVLEIEQQIFDKANSS